MPRKNRKNVAAAPVAPTIDTAADNLTADAGPALDTIAAIGTPPDAPAIAAPAPTPDAPPVTRAPMTLRTIGRLAAGDSTDAAPSPVRSLSLAARFAALHLDPAPVTLHGAFLNVSPVTVDFSAALCDPSTPDYHSTPYTADAASLNLASTLLAVAASDNPAAASPAIVRSVLVLYAHDRAMRATPTRPVGYFDPNGISDLDVRASCARAAARLAGLSCAGLGTRAALAVNVPALRTAVAARLASLAAPAAP